VASIDFISVSAGPSYLYSQGIENCLQIIPSGATSLDIASRNRPLPAKQKPRSPIQLNLESIREKQETDDILSKILKLKNESPEKPLWEGISSYGIGTYDIRFQ
jgi:hypothetical protein